ncbi:MAG TPA: acyl-CoA thioesterase [Thermoanaerobaculia bacterium]|nr:acyl-CoA thioesterase [Thermoanaerobaculia bacterium]
MSTEVKTTPAAIYREEITVPDSAIDENGHVNNVAFVQWMQDVATRHFDAVGGRAAMHTAGGAWVVRSHNVEYLLPAFAGERLQVLTWVANFNRALSLRRYRFLRASDGKTLVRGETQWVFVSTATGRPLRIPVELQQAFPVLPKEEEPQER